MTQDVAIYLFVIFCIKRTFIIDFVQLLDCFSPPSEQCPENICETLAFFACLFISRRHLFCVKR